MARSLQVAALTRRSKSPEQAIANPSLSQGLISASTQRFLSNLQRHPIAVAQL
ncbi:hypothetical protein [Synechococcus sp. PCC 7336]|uniref:hypothetical protein n=1 Tax=Synechococcus sp. PCC 7336 TaxID=195250 RepID=UPI0003491B52|nr:hypothetical protein [Synechococcus sp. PCC 7336]